MVAVDEVDECSRESEDRSIASAAHRISSREVLAVVKVEDDPELGKSVVAANMLSRTIDESSPTLARRGEVDEVKSVELGL